MADTSVVKQIVDKIRDSNNVLVTVNSNPSVDELSAALGITLLINKLDKHATAVFSGEVPPAIEFLNPAKTFEHTVDSLRDFIIALDKEKADHLRYKVEGDMVKIFITPYRTTINQDDLDFSQGDYNVEAVLAIGVKSESDLDRALESHGRILHDATVAAITLGEGTNLGGIEWADRSASSYSEMLYTLADGLRQDKHLIDEQIANAFLTGIVAATDRFSNAQTTSRAMTVAAQLMAAGANQQLIATKLQQEQVIGTPKQPDMSSKPRDEGESARIEKTDDNAPDTSDDQQEDGTGALTISHLPEGDVGEVAEQVGKKNAEAARDRAEEELAKQAKEVTIKHQADATEQAEQKLAQELASAAPAAPSGIPSVADLQKDIAAANDGVEQAQQEVTATLRGPVSTDQWKSHADEKAEEPELGGTLNATTEQAEADSRRAIEDDRNKTILSHTNGVYTSDTPGFQAPLNAVAAQADTEPEVKDIFGQPFGSGDITARANPIQPPASAAELPTLAEIDAKNRSDHDDARAAIDAALNTADAPVAAPVSNASGLPPLPPLPPMPDFSTLPPLPGGSPVQQPAASIPDTLGTVLPPAPADPPVAQPNDPAQFRIPGQ